MGRSLARTGQTAELSERHADKSVGQNISTCAEGSPPCVVNHRGWLGSVRLSSGDVHLSAVDATRRMGALRGTGCVRRLLGHAGSCRVLRRVRWNASHSIWHIAAMTNHESPETNG
jgi:hypothetical protein